MTDPGTSADATLAEQFRRMDADRDGLIGYADYLRLPQQVLDAAGVSGDSLKGEALLDAIEQQWNRLLRLADRDGDGAISLDEYMAARNDPRFRSADRPGKGATLRALFEIADADGDGALSMAEFVEVACFMALPKQEAEKVFMTLDTDGDGRVGFEEFARAVKVLHGS
ncbi:EF-hand domain-containing protein [Streptomyces sp. SAJ15]|uniref:EF-hand domain-containing protein n=1 Tax=Streptomyces sp. SAJ15 TaxID=2011095 RepID=UPI0016430C8B|nr:EF-hand domain-containing protein [Streptomyces sp. SAJ15]